MYIANWAAGEAGSWSILREVLSHPFWTEYLDIWIFVSFVDRGTSRGRCLDERGRVSLVNNFYNPCNNKLGTVHVWIIWKYWDKSNTNLQVITLNCFVKKDKMLVFTSNHLLFSTAATRSTERGWKYSQTINYFVRIHRLFGIAVCI